MEEALSELKQYYRKKQSASESGTAFHIRTKEAKRSVKIKWNNSDPKNTAYPKCLGVNLDRTLSYNEHIQNIKMKVDTKETSKSKWGTNASTIRTTSLSLCNSVAVYAASVWSRSKHAHQPDHELNQACRAITGCLKQTNVEDLYLLARFAPPDIRRDVCAQMEANRSIMKHTSCLVIYMQQIA